MNKQSSQIFYEGSIEQSAQIQQWHLPSTFWVHLWGGCTYLLNALLTFNKIRFQDKAQCMSKSTCYSTNLGETMNLLLLTYQHILVLKSQPLY